MLSDECDNVVIDVSNTQFADSYHFQLWEVDGPQGNWLGNYASGGLFSTPQNPIIDFSTGSNPFATNGAPYNFVAGRWYKLTLGVKGFCTDWNAQVVIFEAKPNAEIEFEVRKETCDDVSIEITNSTGANKYFFPIVELDDNNEWVPGTYQTTHSNLLANSNGWIAGVPPTMINFADNNTSPLGIGYPFTAGSRYLIQAVVQGSCSHWVQTFSTIEIDADSRPFFELDATCNQITLDGTASKGVNTFTLTIEEISILGVPIPGTQLTLPGQGSVGIYNLVNLYTPGFTVGSRYRVTLSTTGSNCPGAEIFFQDFTYNALPEPVIAGNPEACVDYNYYVDLSNSAAVEEIQIEVYVSDQFGLPNGPSTFITGGPNQWVTLQNPTVQIHPSPVTFTAGNTYTVKVYGRNNCSTLVVNDMLIVDAIGGLDCNKVDTYDDHCVTDFIIDPNSKQNSGGTIVDFIGKNNVTSLNVARRWSFSDGTSYLGANATSHTFKRPGTYDVTLEVSNGKGCYDKVTKSVTIKGKTKSGRRVGQDLDAITIAPNPNNGRFTLTYGLDAAPECKLMNLTGQVILTREMPETSNSIQIITEDIPAGLYLVQITQGDALISTQKVLIQR